MLVFFTKSPVFVKFPGIKAKHRPHKKRLSHIETAFLIPVVEILLQYLCESVTKCLEECVLGCSLVQDAAYSGTANGHSAYGYA